MAADDGPGSGLADRDVAVPVRASEAVLAVFEISPVPTAITRADTGLITFANRACLDMLGWDRDDFVGRTMVDVGFWARPERRAAMLEQLATEGRVLDLEEEISTRGGETRIVLTSISKLDLDGEQCLVGHIHDITERRRLEDRLRTSEERFRQIAETSQQGFLLSDIGPRRVLYASPAVATIFGIELDALYDDPALIERLMHPDDREEIVARRRALLLATDFEYRVVRRDGETRWIRTRAEPVRIDDGVATRIASVSEDVTSERGLREALSRSEERFRLLVESVHDYAILMLDVNGRIATWNAGAERFKGYRADEIIGRHFSVFYSAEDIAAGKPERELEVARDVGRVKDEGWRVRKDGTRFWANVLITALRDRDGTLRGYGKVTRDLTERRAAELELRESETRFRLLAENSTDVIGRLSHDQRILYVSPASRSVYGYEPEAMVGRFGWEFIHPEDLATMRTDFSAGAHQPELITNTYRVRRGDGKFILVEANVRALRDPATGDVVEFHTVARDVSERQRAEAEVRRAKEEAELANAAKSEFLSRMSHELRTPLHAILGFGELLAREGLDAGQREHLDQMTRGGRHLLALINEVLDLSRIERGELGLSLEPVHVGQVVQEALEMIAPLAATRPVTVAVPLSDDAEAHVLADRQRLKQVLLNLLSNAVKYNRRAGTIRVVTATLGSPRARVEVTDTGRGIAAADITRVFAAFDRLGAEATDVEGTGLGLALSARLVEAMGGTIGVESEVGHGTTFWIELPVVAAPDVRPPSHERAPARPRPGPPVEGTVLYIEDNPANVLLVERILRERPAVTLLVASQGGLGLELACEHRPALVLLDVNLPDISGEQVLRGIRNDERAAETAVVMLSADATPRQITRLRRAGADDYLTKPFEIDELLAVVDTYVSGAGEGEEPPATRVEDARPPIAGPIDATRLQNLRRLYSDGHALAEFVELFVEDSPARIDALTAAAATGDPEAVRQAAHAWRGACSMVGAHRLESLLAEIEAAAGSESGAIPGADVIADIAARYGEATAALARELA